MSKRKNDDNKQYFAGGNINLTPESMIPYLKKTNYIRVTRGDYESLKQAQERVKNLKRWNYTNSATGYRAKITARTIGKILKPSHKGFNEYAKKYVDNLNAAAHLPALFRRAVYLDSRDNQKPKNSKMQHLRYHHFIAPIRMNGKNYRVRIVARETAQADALYIVEVETLAKKEGRPLPNTRSGNLRANPSVKVTDLVEGVKIYDYDTQSTRIYHGDDLKFST